jgi:FKBP-type peptidyl-prolyl cis-trans isomerase
VDGKVTQLMEKGGKWELFIPRDLGYGSRDAAGFFSEGELVIFRQI